MSELAWRQTICSQNKIPSGQLFFTKAIIGDKADAKSSLCQVLLLSIANLKSLNDKPDFNINKKLKTE